MKKKFLPNSTFFKSNALRIGLAFFILILYSDPNLRGQKWFAIVDAKHNRGLGTYFPNELYHNTVMTAPGEVALEQYPTRWQFKPIKKDTAGHQLYQIIDERHGHSIGVPTDENSRDTWFGNVPGPNETPDRHLWRIAREADTAGLGVTYRIINHHFPNEILGGGKDWNNYIYNYHLVNSFDIGKQCSWRIIESNIGGIGVEPEEYVPTTVRVEATKNQTRICIYGLPGSCYAPNYLDLRKFDLLNVPIDTNIVFRNGSEVRQFWSSLKSGVTYPVNIYIENISNNNNITIPDVLKDTIYDPYNPNWPGNSSILFKIEERKSSPTKYFAKGNYSVLLGTTSLINKIFFFEIDKSNNLGNIEWIIWAAHVSGPTDSTVVKIGDYVDPKEPVMILHDPPGDGSSSKWLKSKMICRELENSFSTSMQHDLNAGMKIGFKSNVGLIVTLEVEAYVKFTLGAGVGSLNGITNSKQTCISTEQGFSTSELGASGDDIFVGYGQNMIYGVGNVIDFDPTNCAKDIIQKRLYYAADGQPKAFAWTITRIKQDMEELKIVAADTINKSDPKKVRTAYEALFQMRTWQKYLDKNEENKRNAKYDSPFQLVGGTKQYASSAIEVTNTTSIVSERFVSASAGMEALLEVAGSGVSGGYKFSTERKYGATTKDSETSKDMLSYEFYDNDPGDDFTLQIGKDPQFGTPIFNTTASRTSCPYEGGYQRDQPKLKHNNTATTSITSEGNSIGSSATFKLDLCNESNEERKYNLKLNANSNLNGAVVSAGGVPLNGNDLGQEFKVPAKSCVEDLLVSVKMLYPNSPLSYPNLELYMYSPCDPDIVSSVFASIYFGNATAVNDFANNNHLSVYPNPTSTEVNLDLKLNASSAVKIELYNFVGGQALISFEEKLPAGNYHKNLSLNHIPSGVYQLILRTDKTQISKKLIVTH